MQTIQLGYDIIYEINLYAVILNIGWLYHIYFICYRNSRLFRQHIDLYAIGNLQLCC